MLEFEPEVEDAVGDFVACELLEVEFVSLDHVVGAAAGPVQERSEREESGLQDELNPDFFFTVAKKLKTKKTQGMKKLKHFFGQKLKQPE